MKRFIRQNTVLPSEPKPDTIPNLGSDFDVVDLLDKGAEILKREISNLMIESSGKKLSPNSAKDLIGYLKLLNELKLEQNKTLGELSDEELEKLEKD